MRPEKTLFVLFMLGALASCYPRRGAVTVLASRSSRSRSIPPTGMRVRQ
jgi:hypothetical protein